MKKFLLICLVVFVILTVAATGYLYINLSPVTDTKTSQPFVINQGEGLSLISKRLQKAGLIKNNTVFIVYAYYTGLNNKLQAGSFDLSPSMTLEQVISKLSRGGSHDYWLKILPGNRVEEIAAKLSAADPSINASQFVAQAKAKEGFLYPDSYLIPQGYGVDQIMDLVNQNFTKKIADASQDNANKTMNQQEIVTLASILEREARTMESRRLVAGILLNRLEAGMPLQVDASVQYASDSLSYKKLGADWSKYDFWQPVDSTKIQAISSPYNTYANPGLPPGPICNPSYESLYAAYHPSASDYLFYITGNDNAMHYAKTLDEHNANIAKYLK